MARSIDAESGPRRAPAAVRGQESIESDRAGANTKTPTADATTGRRWPSSRATWPTAARVTCGRPKGCAADNASLAAGFAVRPIWYYLIASPCCSLVGMVSLPAKVDRLMGTMSRLGIPARTRPAPAGWRAWLVLPFLVLFFCRSLVDFARWQRICVALARGLIVLLLVLALAGLSLLRPTRDLFVVFAVDRSESVASRESRRSTFLDRPSLPLAATVSRCSLSPRSPELSRPAARWEAISAAAADRPTSIALRRPAPPTSRLDDNGTDLAAAIEVAAAACPRSTCRRSSSARWQPDRRATRSRPRALRGKVDVLDRPAAGPQRARGAALGRERPGPGPAGPAVQRRGRDRLQPRRRQGTSRGLSRRHKVADQAYKLKKGENRFVLQQTIDAGGLDAYHRPAQGLSGHAARQQQRLRARLDRGQAASLLIESDPDQAKHLTWALEEQDIQVDVRPPQGCPDNLADLQNYDLFILSNVPATSLRMRQMEVARTLRARPGRRADDAWRRPVVRPGGLL